jgi:NTP pyrophosphatase (non-canonical NTP hydrolase)
MKVVDKIVQWHYARNLIEGSDDRSQFQKLLEEVRELAVSIETDNSPVDDIGDIVVVLINIAERNGLTLEQCLEHAYNDIKDRTGRMVDGVFVKDVVE